jgi:hypothetical protein
MMEIKLRELNGTYYLLLKKELREILGLGETVKLTIEDGKLVIQKIEPDKK